MHLLIEALLPIGKLHPRNMSGKKSGFPEFLELNFVSGNKTEAINLKEDN